MYTLNDYWTEVSNAVKENPDYRWGQAASNIVFVRRPDLWDELVDSPDDPYYKEVTELDDFTNYLDKHWDD